VRLSVVGRNSDIFVGL